MDAFGNGMGAILILSAVIGVIIGAGCWAYHKFADKYHKDVLIDKFFAEVDENGDKLPLTDFLMP